MHLLLFFMGWGEREWAEVGVVCGVGGGEGGMLRTQRAESSVIHFLDCTPESPATYAKASPWNSWQLLQAIFIMAPRGKASTRKMRAEGRLSSQPYNFQDRALTYPSCEQRFRKRALSLATILAVVEPSVHGLLCLWRHSNEKTNHKTTVQLVFARKEDPSTLDSILRVWWRTLPLDTDEHIIVHSWCYN